MSDIASRRLLGTASLAGLAIAAYLTVLHYEGAAPVCATDGCEIVQRSRYAELAGVPVALLGAIAFALLLASAALRVYPAIAVAAGLALVAVLFAGYLVAVQLFVLDAVCVWCLGADTLTLVAAAAAWLRFRRTWT